MKFIVKNFLRGILSIVPVFLTLYIVYAVFKWVDNLGKNAVGVWLGQGTLLTGIGFALTIALITTVGYLSSLWLGAAFMTWIEKSFAKSPLLTGIYCTIRDTLHSFLGEKRFFSQAVSVHFPNEGYRRIGFMTRESSPLRGGDQDQIVVYLPHSFQISGDMVIVPRKNVEFLDLPPEKVMKMILSGGIVKD